MTSTPKHRMGCRGRVVVGRYGGPELVCAGSIRHILCPCCGTAPKSANEEDHETVKDLSQLERAFEGAAVWGLEVDTRYRVFAATVGIDANGATALPVLPQSDDERIQVLMYPVSTILASLRDDDTVLTFTQEQLVDVASAFGGARLASPIFGGPEPQPGAWAPTWSLEGRSNAPDGRQVTATFSVQQDGHALDVFLRFDDVQLRDADGNVLYSSNPAEQPW